ncbi:MAG: hypothetical protein EHM93_07080 [Bacteroidales bacterium]|nr:MAG: hypothetical protein EHM93_07080 [Bacteroidales bacterium]
MTRRFIFFVVVILLFSSCNSCRNSNKDVSDAFEIPDSLKEDNPVPISAAVIDDMVQNIASPIETAAVLKGLKVPFNKDLIANTDFAENFNTNFAKALGLGIYGCDLGYLNMYGKTSLVIDYISTIRSLADGIQVGQFFDFSTLKRLATNNENIDSLVLISQQSMSRIDTYLRENNRSNLSMVIVAGVWIEGLYISSVVTQESNHKRMRDIVGEQKEIINLLMPLLNHYKKDPNMAKLIKSFEEIKKLYSDVKISYEIGEATTLEVNGELQIKQNDVQTIEMSDETLQKIIDKVKEIRIKLLKG